MTVSIGRGPRLDPEVLVTLAAACRDGVRLGFAYRAHDGTSSERRVEPLRLAHTGNRRWYLVAWDLDRDAWRTFRVDRVQRPVSGERFTPRAPPAGSWWRGIWTVAPGARPASISGGDG